jgi:fluoride exporter
MLQAIGLVMLGGAFGAVARYLVTHAFSQVSTHRGFPIGTLLVNVLGSFAVGYVLTWTADHSHDRWRLLAATGFCGGFTTFSAFAYETMVYWHNGEMMLLALNIGLNNFLSFVALLLGIAAHKGSAS